MDQKESRLFNFTESLIFVMFLIYCMSYVAQCFLGIIETDFQKLILLSTVGFLFYRMKSYHTKVDSIMSKDSRTTDIMQATHSSVLRLEGTVCALDDKINLQEKELEAIKKVTRQIVHDIDQQNKPKKRGRPPKKTT